MKKNQIPNKTKKYIILVNLKPFLDTTLVWQSFQFTNINSQDKTKSSIPCKYIA